MKKTKTKTKKAFARWSSGTITSKTNIKQKNLLRFVYMYDIIDTHSTCFLCLKFAFAAAVSISTA